jgi:hypothetical protein|tara:strand:- start:449 stop:664 length:216 start_codon:yes stop_codon:yes gene_type:complete
METDDMNDGGKIQVSFNMDELVLIADAIMNNTLKVFDPDCAHEPETCSAVLDRVTCAIEDLDYTDTRKKDE